MSNKAVDSITPLQSPRCDISYYQGHTEHTGLVSFERSNPGHVGGNDKSPGPEDRYQTICGKIIMAGQSFSQNNCGIPWLVGNLFPQDKQLSGSQARSRPPPQTGQT